MTEGIKYVIVIKVRRWGDWGYAIAPAIQRRGSIPRRLGPISCCGEFCNMHNMQFNLFFDQSFTLLYIAKKSSKLPVTQHMMV
jgi:hypothetical protein